MERDYSFLKQKYNELLLPTLFMVMSEKVAMVIDVIIIGAIIGGNELSAINLISPLLYITGIFYILFGQGGSLLALRAKSELDEDKSNFYFTISILGIIIVTLIYILVLFVFADNILHMLNAPADIYGNAKAYLLAVLFFFPLNCYILVISFFLRSDGYPKLPFYTVLIANVSNLILDVVFLKVFNLGIMGAALASVVGYLIGSIYISRYFISKNRNFQFVSIAKLKLKQSLASIKEIALNTPEVTGKIFFSTRMTVYTYLCSTHYGAAGLLAYLVYDNSETFVYIVLSAIMKTMSPIVTVFYKEMDYKAVDYIMRRSTIHLLMCCIPVSILFFIYPELLIKLFNITNPEYVQIISFAIRVTSFGLIGRCMTYLMANYTQAIGFNKISFTLTFLEEFAVAIASAVILTYFFGGPGIWYAILISESVPVIVYFYYVVRFKNSRQDELDAIFMLQDSNLMVFTYDREYDGNSDDDLDIGDTFGQDSQLFAASIKDICEDIFVHDPNLDEVDITIRLINEKAVVQFIDDGELYNPFSNEELLNSSNIKKLKDINCEFDYTNVLGFNKSYIQYNPSLNLLKINEYSEN